MELASLLRAKMSHGLVDNRLSPRSTETIIHAIHQNHGFCWIRAPGAGYIMGVLREWVGGGAAPRSAHRGRRFPPVPQRATVC